MEKDPHMGWQCQFVKIDTRKKQTTKEENGMENIKQLTKKIKSNKLVNALRN